MVFEAAMKNPRRRWRAGPAATICTIFAASFIASLFAGACADTVLVGRWMAGTCGEWAPPGWKNDPRCDGSLYPLEVRAFTIAKWSAGGLCLASAWWTFRNRRMLWQKFLGEDVRKR